jgi:hypothetical protein
MTVRRGRAARKWTRTQRVAVAVASAVAGVTLVTILITQRALLDSRLRAPATALEFGWQFYERPTSLAPPGTVFRITRAGKRYDVGEIQPPTMTGAEAFGTTSLTVRTTARMIGRFLAGSGSVGERGNRVETIEFVMYDVQREVTTDMGVADVLTAFRSKVKYEDNSRYYLIRESRSATAMRYSFSEEVVNSLQGEGGLEKLVKSNTGLSYEKRGSYVVDQKLPQRMRVMFLAEEIIPRDSLVGTTPRFQVVPVTEPLVWQ